MLGVHILLQLIQQFPETADAEQTVREMKQKEEGVQMPKIKWLIQTNKPASIYHPNDNILCKRLDFNST